MEHMKKEPFYLWLCILSGIGYAISDYMDFIWWVTGLLFILQIVFFIYWLDAAANMK